jgi:hypothetical protein
MEGKYQDGGWIGDTGGERVRCVRNTIPYLPELIRERDLLESGYGGGRGKQNEQGTVDKNSWTFSEFLMILG